MKILLIDNEAPIRETLRAMVQSWSEGHHEIADANGVATGLTAIAAFQPDIVLLDVEMDDGQGFDLLRKLEQTNFQLIFTTAHNQYAVQAFKVSAIDYLLKPIDPYELHQSLNKAMHNIKQMQLQQQVQVLLQQVAPKPETERQIVLKDMEKTYFVKMKDVLFCEAEGAYTKFNIANTEPIFVSKNLRFYEDLLSDAGFIRTHHSCLVNSARIKLFDRKIDSGVLVLDTGHTIPVSQRKKEYVMQYLENKGN